jgi:anti-anti-sigma factor
MSDVELDNQRFAVTSTDTGWSLSGEIDASAVPRLAEAVEQLPGHAGAIVLDVKDVSFIDSSGLRVLIALAERARGEGRVVELDNPSSFVTRLLEITGLTDMFGSGERPTA